MADEAVQDVPLNPDEAPTSSVDSDQDPDVETPTPREPLVRIPEDSDSGVSILQSREYGKPPAHPYDIPQQPCGFSPYDSEESHVVSQSDSDDDRSIPSIPQQSSDYYRMNIQTLWMEVMLNMQKYIEAKVAEDGYSVVEPERLLQSRYHDKPDDTDVEEDIVTIDDLHDSDDEAAVLSSEQLSMDLPNFSYTAAELDDDPPDTEGEADLELDHEPELSEERKRVTSSSSSGDACSTGAWIQPSWSKTYAGHVVRRGHDPRSEDSPPVATSYGPVKTVVRSSGWTLPTTEAEPESEQTDEACESKEDHAPKRRIPMRKPRRAAARENERRRIFRERREAAEAQQETEESDRHLTSSPQSSDRGQTTVAPVPPVLSRHQQLLKDRRSRLRSKSKSVAVNPEPELSEERSPSWGQGWSRPSASTFTLARRRDPSSRSSPVQQRRPSVPSTRRTTEQRTRRNEAEDQRQSEEPSRARVLASFDPFYIAERHGVSASELLSRAQASRDGGHAISNAAPVYQGRALQHGTGSIRIPSEGSLMSL